MGYIPPPLKCRVAPWTCTLQANHLCVQLIDMVWLPAWARSVKEESLSPWSPVRLARRNQLERKRSSSSISSLESKQKAHQQNRDKSTELPTPQHSRRLRLGAASAAFALCIILAAVAAVLHPSLPSRSWQMLALTDGGSEHGTAAAKLPFLEGKGGGGGQGRADVKHWIRVHSPTAMHPAMYVPGDGMVYCPIAKVACAEWRKTLRWMLGIPDWDSGPIHEQGKNGIPLLAMRTVREVELIMNDRKWLKFVVVRDPADRLLSAFLNKCVGREWQNCPYLDFMPQRFPGVKRRSPATDKKFQSAIDGEPRKVFRDFMMGVRKDVRLRGCKVNSHWRPQYCFCSIARFRENYHVIPFSNMSTEAVSLVDLLSRPSPARADLLREFMVRRFSSNQDSKAMGAATKRQRFFSSDVLDMIKTVYEKDYGLFGDYFEEHTATPLPQ